MLCDEPSFQRLAKSRTASSLSERAIKRVYARLEREREVLLESLGNKGKQEDRERYASLVLGSLLVVYFLQKKGLLGRSEDHPGGERDYLFQCLRRVQREWGYGHFQSFFHALLLRLFHRPEKSRPQQQEFDELLKDVSFLNDDVMAISEMSEKYGLLSVSDEIFERLVRFLNEFEWRLDGHLLQSEKEFNLDVVGSLFEKYGGQKQMGVYYTQADITEYIGKNSIIPRLFECLARKWPTFFRPDGPAWTLLRTDPERYIYPALKQGCTLPLPLEIEEGVNEVSLRETWDEFASAKYALPLETWREVVTRRQRYEQLKTSLLAGDICSINKLITYNLNICQFARDVILSIEQGEMLVAFYESLVGLTVLDPTCGSGAFLLAALAILESLYVACLERAQQMAEERKRQNKGRECEREGQLWGSIDEFVKQANCFVSCRAFFVKTIIANNLYGVDIMSSAAETCKLRLFLKLISLIETSAEVGALPELHFNIRTGNALIGVATRGELDSILERHATASFMMPVIQQAQEVERLFIELQDCQRDPACMTERRGDLQKRLCALGSQWSASLDVALALDYGIDVSCIPVKENEREKFAAWRKMSQPFHWLSQWYGVLRKGGFDVILGNPPYVAYHKVRELYQVQTYETQDCGNLCAYVLERSATLLCPHGRWGMIVPVSTIASENYRPLARLLLAKQTWISSYANRPGKLFANVEQRLAILLAHNVDSRTVLTSAYQHWYEAERKHLFATLAYVPASTWEPTGMPVKSGSRLAESIFTRLMQHQGFSLLNPQRSEAAVWVHNGPTYWVRALPFEPNSGQKSPRSRHYYKLSVDTQQTAFALTAILSSSIFYFFYKLVSNCRDLGQKELRLFPLGQLQPASEEHLAHLGSSLAQLLKDTTRRRTRRYTNARLTYESSYEEYYPARAGALLKQIDYVLAEHYGLSEEELDFLSHYDSKYRQRKEDARKNRS